MQSYEDLVATVERVVALLKREGVDVEPGSLLERSCNEVRANLDRYLRPETIDPTLDFRVTHRETAGLMLLFQRLLRAVDNGGLPAPIIPHLRKLNSGVVSQAVPYRDITLTGSQKNASDKISELVIGLAAAEVGMDLEMDDPDGSSGGVNPDILVTINGERWSFPVKVPSPTATDITQQMRSVRKNLKKGFEQIRASAADKGFVVINVRNLFDHDALNPEVPGGDTQDAPRQFAAFERVTVNSLIHRWMANLGSTLRSKNAMRDVFALCGSDVGYGFLAYCETAVDESIPAGILPSYVAIATHIRCGEVVTYLPPPVEKLVKALVGENSRPFEEEVAIPGFRYADCTIAVPNSRTR